MPKLYHAIAEYVTPQISSDKKTFEWKWVEKKFTVVGNNISAESLIPTSRVWRHTY